MDTLHGKIVATQVGKVTGEERLREKVAFIYGSLLGYRGRPTDSQLSGLDELASQVAKVTDEVKAVTTVQLPAINRDLLKAGKSEIKITTPEEFFNW